MHNATRRGQGVELGERKFTGIVLESGHSYHQGLPTSLIALVRLAILPEGIDQEPRHQM